MTVIAGLVTYPLDTIHLRMMMTSGEEVKYKGVIDCAMQIVRAEGVAALYEGVGMYQ